MNLPLSFKVLPPQVISKYTRICIIIGVCDNACRTVLKPLQFIMQSFTRTTPYHAAIVKVWSDKAIRGGRGKQWLMRFIAPIPEEVFLDKASTWFSHLSFSSIRTPRDLEHWIGGFHVTSSPPCWWTVNKRSLISSLCLSTSICSFHHCYLRLPRLHENHLLERYLYSRKAEKVDY